MRKRTIGSELGTGLGSLTAYLSSAERLQPPATYTNGLGRPTEPSARNHVVVLEIRGQHKIFWIQKSRQALDPDPTSVPGLVLTLRCILTAIYDNEKHLSVAFNQYFYAGSLLFFFLKIMLWFSM